MRAAKTLSPGCAGSPHAKIQDAINAAVSGDVVEVCSGTYRERLTISGKVLTLREASGASVTIDGQWLGKTISVTNGANVTLEGFTILNGKTTGTGGNVYCSASTLTVRNNVIEDGEASKGGGVGMSGCTGSVEGNTFRDNVAEDKGGGLHADGSIAVLANTFEANHSEEFGGAAYLSDSFANIDDNIVIGNTAVDDGGGIYVYKGAPFIGRNTFEVNESSDGEGGGLRVKSAEATITDNTFLENHADYRGGAAKISHDEVVMTGNTYIGNTSWTTAGAVLLFESASDLAFETYVDNDSDKGGAIAIIEGWGSVDIVDSTFENNDADLGGHLYIDLLGYKTKLRRVDLVDGTGDQGGAVYALSSEIKFENTLMENNSATVGGGALYLDATSGTIVNGVISGSDAPVGAAMQIVNGPVAPLTVSNTIFYQNLTGATVQLTSGTAPVFKYDDFYGNTSNFAGMLNQVGKNGNLAVAPGFVNATGSDFHLTSTSGVKDKGDPAVSDLDGTRSDMGIYGGPYSD